MSDSPAHQPDKRPNLLVNLGSGPKGSARLPAMFADWCELRVDIDATAAPDILADVTDLSAIASGSVDAVWASHCIEHLFLHEGGAAVARGSRAPSATL